MKIEIRPIEKEKWHGKKEADNFMRDKTISVLVDRETKLYATGLNYTDTDYEDQETGEKVTEASYYAKLLKQNLSNVYIPGTPHEFWEAGTMRIKLPNSTMFLETNNPFDHLKYKVIKCSKFVANSLREYQDNLYPDATHYIVDGEEEMELKAKKAEVKFEVYQKYNELTKTEKIQLILILGEKNLKDKSDSMITLEMEKLMESKPREILEFLKKPKKEIVLEALLKEAIQKNVLKYHKTKYFYGDAEIASNYEELTRFFEDESNQELKVVIMNKVQ
ncbi:MAG: hypothetical protein ACRC0V_07210 [Fusobacteriaceae bacterium]|uniref:hypothetical protein n=1 Tax=Romboutsia sp. TaxID=1965302 RepID=UPI003F33C7AA